MTVDAIIEQAGIPLLLLVICVYYAIRLIVLHDSQAIRGKNKPPVKDEEAYCKAVYVVGFRSLRRCQPIGRMLLFFGAATFLMAILVFVNVYVAVAEIIICTVILGILWKRMEDQYGG